MDKATKTKRGLELVTSHSSGHKTSSEKFLYSLYIIWPSLMIWCKAVIPKIASANLRKSIHDIINYSTSSCPFESGKCGKVGKNHKNLNILRIKNIWNKKHFSKFVKGYHLVKKTENLISNLLSNRSSPIPPPL